VGTVRKQEHRSVAKEGTSPLTGSQWAWLKTYADGRNSEAISFRALSTLNLKTNRAWRLKETFPSSGATAKPLLPSVTCGLIQQCHETGLLNYSRHRISHARAEGFNSAIQLIKANARGVSQLHQLPGKDSVSLRKVGPGVGVREKSQ